MENEKLRSDVKLASKKTGIDMPALIHIIETYKLEMQGLFHDQASIQSERISTMEASHRELESKCSQAIDNFETCST
jgi:hypothetical protein